MTTRTDIHRPGAICPANYSLLSDYILPGPDPFETWNVKETREMLASARNAGKAIFGSMGKCGVCGTAFRYGSVYEHGPSGDLVHFGQECAHKYEILADHDDFDAQKEAFSRNRASRIEADLNAKHRVSILADNPGLEAAFQVKHHIIADIKAQFDGSRVKYLSGKQIALVLKIAKDIADRAAMPAEVNVNAPSGRQTFRGIVVSKKAYDGAYGTSIKVTVKVTTSGGVWLAWGTLPAALLTSGQNDGAMVGDEIELTGTLTVGDKPHFAFFKRPNGRIISRGKGHELSQVSSTYAVQAFREHAWIKLGGPMSRERTRLAESHAAWATLTEADRALVAKLGFSADTMA